MDQPYLLKQCRELLIDDFHSETRIGDLRFRLHSPQALPEEPTQPRGHYQTVIFADGLYRLYYRGQLPVPEATPQDGNPGEYTAYAESADGRTWRSPELGLFPGRPANAVWAGSMATHNFAPFLDERPGCPPEERFKALGGVQHGGGLYAFTSPDGIHWRSCAETPAMLPPKDKPWSFDSQNVAFWSAAEQCYVLYYRVFQPVQGKNLRAICKTTSDDFRHWQPGEFMALNRDGEHLYVSQMAPYCRAPQLYIGTPTRFFEDRGCATDISLCFSRAGGPLFRSFPGAWITPGPDPARWGNRSNYLARNIVPTGPTELSLYHAQSGRRYVMRPDGFVSLHGGLVGGEWTSKALTYGGGRLSFNVATSAGGSMAVELLDSDGRALPGATFAEHDLFYGDTLRYVPTWRGREELPLRPGDVFRMRCRLQEADLFSFAVE
ncbi:MAG: hypothetical protein GX617_01250 [Lentisphaerae bacterium]|nr:hypothetical protein [Lentisphaerota bacterium]